MASLNRTMVGGRENARQMLEAAGIGEYNAILSLPYIYFLPRTCDPYAQGVMQLVEGLQNLLKARGLAVPKDGVMGPSTIAAVKQYAGPGWGDKTWLQIYGDVLRGKKGISLTVPELAEMPDTHVATDGFTDMIGSVATNPWAWMAVGAAMLYQFGWKRTNPSRSRSRR